MKIKKIIAAIMALTIVGVNYGSSHYGLSEGSYAYAAESETKETVVIDGLEYKVVDGGYALDVRSIRDNLLPEDGVYVIPDEADGIPVVALTGRWYGGGSVKLGKNIKSIGEICFNHGLDEIELNDALESIGDQAFQGSNIKEIKYGTNVKYIGRGCFMGCEKLEKVEFEESDDPERELVIGVAAFEGCKNIKELKLCNGIKKIPEMCFKDASITSLVLPDSVESIGDRAFDRCTELKELKCGKGLKEIGGNAFSVSPFESIEFNEGLTYIYDGAFSQAEINDIKLPESLEYIGSLALRVVHGDIVIPANVVYLANGNFQGSDKEKDTLTILNPECIIEPHDLGVKEIRGYKGSTAEKQFGSNLLNYRKFVALEGEWPESYKKPYVQDGMQYVLSGIEAFYCGTTSDFKGGDVVIPDEVEGRPVDKLLSDLPSKGVRSITIGKNIKELGSSKFEGFDELEKIVFKEGLERITINAINDTYLSSFDLPASVNYVYFCCDEKGAISVTIRNPEAFITSYFDLDYIDCIRGYKDSTAEKFAAENNITFIDIEAEEANTPAEDIVVDDCLYKAVTGGYSFASFPDDVNELVIPDEVNGYPVVAVDDNVSMRSADREKLVSVKFGKNIKTVGKAAFRAFEKLETVEFNDGLKEVKDDAFYGTLLREVILPKSVSRVGKGAFYSMNKAAHRGNVAVYNRNCILAEESIKNMTVAGYRGSTAEKYAENAKLTFFDLEDKTTPHISYLADGMWYEPVQGGYAVRGLPEDLTELIIPDEVNGYAVIAVIDDMYAQSGHNANLISVKLGKNVTYIGKRAFQGCKNIKTLELNDKLEIVGELAFCDSADIESELVFPETVKSIGSRAFSFSGHVPGATILNSNCEMGEKCIYGTEIVGYKGSTAEKYAEENMYYFRALEGTPVSKKAGDTNGDGNVDLADAILIMQALANPNKYGVGGTADKPLTEQGKLNGDVDKDVVGLTANDALKIQEYLIGRVESLG
ncbi:leucine-rich repeat protein [Ruminococcus flavefaciens]|uniref:leucine-rich repeat protein n=1 Tax=Ruminococcus flavefaciens TaxID=1265 RepID=UPI00031EFA93|nr:leucine-rich repeat protein [Ruminococcus flavefaciens]